MTLIQLVVLLIVIGVALYLVGLIPMDQTIKTIIRIVVIAAVVLWVLDMTGLMNSGPVIGRHRL
jgi:hypothetical protein